MEGWKGSVLHDSDLVPSAIGDHMIRVTPPKEQGIVEIPVLESYYEGCASLDIYIKCTDCTKPTRIRLNALNEISPKAATKTKSKDIGDETDVGSEDTTTESHPTLSLDPYKTLRSILVGRSLPSRTTQDFLAGVSEEDLKSILNSCTPRQKRDIMQFARFVPSGFLIMTGAQGTGKTTALIAFILAHLSSNQKVGVYASSNSAVNNITQRTLRAMAKSKNATEEDKLCIRMWSDQIETKVLTGIDHGNIHSFIEKQPVQRDAEGNKKTPKLKSAAQKLRERADYDFSISAAAAVCKVMGIIATNNKKIPALREKNLYPDLKLLLAKPAEERQKEDRKTIISLSIKVIQELMLVGDMVFATTSVGAGKEGLMFQKSADLITVDEAGACTELEVISVVRACKKVILLEMSLSCLQQSCRIKHVGLAPLAYATLSQDKVRCRSFIDSAATAGLFGSSQNN